MLIALLLAGIAVLLGITLIACVVAVVAWTVRILLGVIFRTLQIGRHL